MEPLWPQPGRHGGARGSASRLCLGLLAFASPGSLLELTDFLFREACGADPPLRSPPSTAPPSTAGCGSGLAVFLGFCPASAGRFGHNQGGTSDQLLWLSVPSDQPVGGKAGGGSEPCQASSWVAAPRGLGRPGWDLGAAPRLCQVSAAATSVRGAGGCSSLAACSARLVGPLPRVAPRVCARLSRPGPRLPRPGALASL